MNREELRQYFTGALVAIVSGLMLLACLGAYLAACIGGME